MVSCIEGGTGSSGLRLHTREWGSGERVAVLAHGMAGESRQFWEVGPALADRGFRVIAVDLPGHGHSGPCLSGGLGAFAQALAASVPNKPAIALGHSLGAMVVAAALPRLQPSRAVYVDVPFQPLDPDGQGQDAEALTAAFDRSKAERTAARLAETRPWWKRRDCEIEEAAAERVCVRPAQSRTTRPRVRGAGCAGSGTQRLVRPFRRIHARLGQLACRSSTYGRHHGDSPVRGVESARFGGDGQRRYRPCMPELDNVASARVIDHHGGVLEEICDTESGRARRYWVALA